MRALRGRLDVVRQFAVHAVRPDRLACPFDALDADTPLLQMMKACVVLVGRHARATATQRKLAELRFLLAEVSDVEAGALPWRQVRIDRASRRWQALLDLARLLLGSRWQQTHAAAREPEGVALLFPMNDLFERDVAVQLRRALTGSGLEVVAQGGLRYCVEPWNGEGGYSHATRPDILIRRGNDVQCVIDTKWKQLANGVSQSDVYQMMAYARLTAARASSSSTRRSRGSWQASSPPRPIPRPRKTGRCAAFTEGLRDRPSQRIKRSRDAGSER